MFQLSLRRRNDFFGRRKTRLRLRSAFAVHDVKVLSVDGRVLVAMPNRKNRDGTYRDVAHPINPLFRQAVEEAVLTAYEEALHAAEAGEDPVAPDSDPGEPPTV